MASKKGGEELDKEISMQPLLCATMCMVGHTVEVQVKDGSFYSGILHTAIFDKDHGIVLKKAKKTKNGTSRTNLAVGDCVDTLIVFSSDLVQVVVKSLLLPTEETFNHVAARSPEVLNEVHSQTCCRDKDREVNGTCENFTASREVAGCRAEGDKHDNPSAELLHEAQHLGPSSYVNDAQCGSPASPPVQLVSPESDAPNTLLPALSDAKISVCSTSSVASDIVTLSCPSRPASSDATIPKNKPGSISAKESKLNPSAKVFTPSGANFRQVSAPVPRLVSQSQMPSNLPVMPVAGAQLGTEMNSFGSHFTAQSKLVSYNNLIAAQAGIATPYTRPPMGHASVRQLPVRINSQYHPLQAGHLYFNQHPQMVTAGPLHQPVYVQPVSQDAIQGTPIMAQGQPHHPLFTQSNALKFQGAAVAQTLHLPATPPIMSGENQTLAAPSHVPFPQPFPVAQPFMIPGANGYMLH